MTAPSDAPLDADLLAIDVGSSCIKLGWFRAAGACGDAPASGLPIAASPLPTPEEMIRVEHRQRDADAWGAELDGWLDATPASPDAWCLVGSVHPGIGGAVLARLAARRWSRCAQVAAAQLPIEVRTATPQRVGIDRLLGALAVNRLRAAGRPAISIDMGTATTVDLIAADGGFLGGAILAGAWLSLAALHAGTASLPGMDESAIVRPATAVGVTTEQALLAGAYWGALGGVNEMVRRVADEAGAPPELYLTGGAAPAFADDIELVGRPARHVPHLVLAGLRLAAAEWPS